MIQADLLFLISAKLRELTGNKRADISASTEVFYDLNLHGWDFDEFVDWLEEKFGNKFSSLRLKDYAPAEGYSFSQILLSLGLARPYKSLTVNDIVEMARLQ